MSSYKTSELLYKSPPLAARTSAAYRVWTVFLYYVYYGSSGLGVVEAGAFFLQTSADGVLPSVASAEAPVGESDNDDDNVLNSLSAEEVEQLLWDDTARYCTILAQLVLHFIVKVIWYVQGSNDKSGFLDPEYLYTSTVVHVIVSK